MVVTWYLCDLKTGRVIDELPLKVSADLESTVSTPTTLGATLDVHDEMLVGKDWVTLIDPMRAMIVPVVDDFPLGVAYVIDADSAGAPSATMNLTSIETILDAVNVRTHDFSLDVDDEADAAATLITDVIADSFGFELDVTHTGQTGDHSYAFEEDRTVGSAVNDLASADGGPEWTMRVTWADEKHNRFIKTVQIAKQIGATVPSVTFEDVHLDSRTRNRSYARGNRATYVIATGDGSGPERPMSAPAVDGDALDAGVPQWEVRIAKTAVDDIDQLNRLAVAGLERRWSGIQTWEMRLALKKPGCPVPGRDFNAGDMVDVQTGPQEHDPATWYGPARVIGWRATIAGRQLVTVTPVFFEPKEDAA